MRIYKLYHYLFSFLIVASLCTCTLFKQNDFVISEDISTIQGEKICYDVFQTGVDNYRFEFKSVSNSDTTRLFETYVNDAVYTAMRFKIRQEKDTLLITTNYPTDRMFGKTQKGTMVVLVND